MLLKTLVSGYRQLKDMRYKDMRLKLQIEKTEEKSPTGALHPFLREPGHT